MKTGKWIRTTIVEAFPVFYGKDMRGPFYAPNSEWFVTYTEKNLAWKQLSAEALRRDGYTVHVDVVER